MCFLFKKYSWFDIENEQSKKTRKQSAIIKSIGFQENVRRTKIKRIRLNGYDLRTFNVGRHGVKYSQLLKAEHFERQVESRSTRKAR